MSATATRKTVTIVTKAEALRIQREHDGQTQRWAYCTGKYKPGTKQYIGREVEASADVLAIYPESRSDRHGPFVKLMCIDADPVHPHCRR